MASIILMPQFNILTRFIIRQEQV